MAHHFVGYLQIKIVGLSLTGMKFLEEVEVTKVVSKLEKE